jgi:hypothetical protein
MGFQNELQAEKRMELKTKCHIKSTLDYVYFPP